MKHLDLPTSKLENWKYSPVQLLTETYREETSSSLFSVDDGAHVQLFTRHDEGLPFKSTALEIVIGQNASLHHWHLFDEGSDAVHVERLKVQVSSNARYTFNSLTLGSRWSRSDLVVSLLGEGAKCDLVGLDLAKGSSHIDRHVLIEHLAAATSSSQLFKGIFDDDASGSFFGKIRVKQGADGTSAKQVNRSLLLSSGAIANTRPQLEIDTDDVACTHGATVGQLDENAIFFLRSRGLSQAEARRLLTEAFAREVLNAFKVSDEQADLERLVRAWLTGGDR